MKNNTITIHDVQYPARMTMGAMMEFKDRTGKEVTELQGADITLAVTLLFCCVASSCRADNVSFPFASPTEMADWMDAEDFAAWQGEQFETDKNVHAPEEKGKKK